MKVGWSNGLAEWIEGDTVYLSVVFSWRLPDAFERAVWYGAQGLNVRVGGPAVWANPKYMVGVAEIGGQVNALERHNSRATVASRGCPVGCYFCIVPKMEGKEFTLLWDFVPRPILCDNNLSALSVEYQEHIIRRYQETGTLLEDANSGFEPLTFDQDTYHRWSVINRGPWRFALDETKEIEDVRRVMAILKDVPYWRKRIYILIGNESIADCYERIAKVIEWGGEPHVQPFISMTALEKSPVVKHDWTKRRLLDMARWANRWLWRSIPLVEYRGIKSERPTFEGWEL